MFSLEFDLDEKYWPLMPPLPSYGYGREHRGARYGSLIHGQNLKDVVVTGHNGTINGQGQTWWKKYRQKLLNHTRGPLVQIMCSNTDGIDPDSCEDMVIEDCYISVGDDGIAIKSGWDQYGVAYGRPSVNILIRNLVIRSMVSAGVSIGSEMSGGVSNVTVENLLVWNSRRAVRIKTSPGRGGYVQHINYRNLTFDNVRVGIVIKTDYNEHPDDGFDPKLSQFLRT
ncbi:putative polygalacturonase [Vitis vinifera]|uniref:Putative polygalacturonase n=1 Tax=Vitis vinifera TaxID=29760 RepID=A0A438J8X7_VITVI|nr:putative polygalacturonase [Vitis vinifera]